MTYRLSESAARVLEQIDAAGSCVVGSQGSITRLLAAGELIPCMADTSLRLIAFGFLDADGSGRLTPTRKGREAADLFRGGRRLWREPEGA